MPGTKKSSPPSELFCDRNIYRSLKAIAPYRRELFMTLATRIAPHLPYLRRYSRALTGTQTSGDAYVAAVLEAIIADISIFPDTSNDRVALYKLFTRLFGSPAVQIPEPTSPYAWEQRATVNGHDLVPSISRFSAGRGRLLGTAPDPAGAWSAKSTAELSHEPAPPANTESICGYRRGRWQQRE